jgi:tetratricopeptide (TPR) repeat protein
VVLGAFADGTLDAATHAEVERHVAGCFECAFVSGSTVCFLEEEQEKKRWWRKRWSFFAAAAMLALMITTFLWQSLRTDRGLSGIRRAATSSLVRPVEGRLTGFPHAPFILARSQTAPPDTSLGIRAAAEKVARRPGSSAETLHARGVAFLLLGRTPDAVNMLTAATQRAPGNASYWNDLAVARIASAAFAEAVDAADHALAISSSLAAAHFNRAVALAHLRHREAAIDAYLRAVEADPRSPWAAEVRVRLEQLAARPR